MQHASTLEDRRLLLRLIEGEIEAFDQLFKLYYIPLVVFLNKGLKSVAAAEDIAQVVFCYIWERRSTLNPEGSIRGYIFRAGRNRMIDAIKENNRFIFDNYESADGLTIVEMPSSDLAVEIELKEIEDSI